MTTQVPISGFGVPPLPASAQESGGPARQPANAQPGHVPPPQNVPNPADQANATPAAGTFTQAQLDAAVAAALAGKTAAPAVVTTPSAGITASEISSASDPVLKSMTDLLISSGPGVDMERVLSKALQYGDAALIDTAYLIEKGGANGTHLVNIAKAIVDRVQAQAVAQEQSAFSAAGGEQQWRASAAVFDQNAPAHLKLVVKTMLDSGNSESVGAAAKMVVEFGAASGKLPQLPGLVHAGAAGAGAVGALGAEEFKALHFKLDPNSRTYASDRSELLRRRQLGKQLGTQ